MLVKTAPRKLRIPVNMVLIVMARRQRGELWADSPGNAVDAVVILTILSPLTTSPCTLWSRPAKLPPAVSTSPLAKAPPPVFTSVWLDLSFFWLKGVSQEFFQPRLSRICDVEGSMGNISATDHPSPEYQAGTIDACLLILYSE